MLALGRARQVRFEERAHLRQRQRADEFVDDSAAAEQLDRGNAADLELLREVLVLVGVHLDDLDLACVLVGDLLEHRTERAARAAPRGPEIDEHGLLGGGIEDLGGETGRGDGVYGWVHAPRLLGLAGCLFQ